MPLCSKTVSKQTASSSTSELGQLELMDTERERSLVKSLVESRGQ